MSKPKSLFKTLTETGPLTVLAVAIALLIGIAGPASAQFFNFGFGQPSRPAPRGGGWFGDFFTPYQPEQPKRIQQDFSKAPPPAKRDTTPEQNILVLGDGMADWLAYGLEDAYAEQPDMGVIRRHKTTSGLIKYQPKGEPADWAAAARGLLANEKPDAIVVMLGLNDRIAIREPAPDKTDKPSDKKTDKKDGRAKSEGKPDAKSDAKSEGKPADGKPKADGEAAAKPDDKADSELDEADSADAPPVAAPEKTARSPNGLYEFRDDRWVELYSKKIEELIGVLKTKGVPVLWVGLPAIRGQKGTADMLFLDSLYRDGAGKAGITYVDVWDGFVDEAGRFLQKGPDFEGQIRQLRTSDGVYFTKPGARKLAHYVEREITRLAARSGPVALPTEPATPDANMVPGQPAPRPLAGPIVPLVASSIATDQLLGGPGSRPAGVDALAARTMVKGEALTPPPGRADDYSWPRREVGREQARGDTPVASTSPDTKDVSAASPNSAPPPPPKLRRIQPAPQQMQPAPLQSGPPSFRDFFGFGFGAPPQRQFGPPPRAPTPGGPLRPPANVGRSAAVPNYPRWQ
jgi:hypothetical protein